MSSTNPIPIVILGGSGGQPTRLPHAGGGYHPLTGYKGVDLRIDGRALISHLVDRIAAADAFGPIYIAGPERVYGTGAGTTEVIDTDGTLGMNLRAAIREVRRRHEDTTVAFIACDVLPTGDELRRLAELYHASALGPLWFPLVEVAATRKGLGAFAWKPGYRFRVEKSERILDDTPDSMTVFPGHLVIARPAELRLGFLYRLVGAVYAARNRSIPQKSRALILRMLLALLWEDCKGLCRGKAPTFTYRMLRTALASAPRMRDGDLTLAEAADALTQLTVTDPSRHSAQLPVVDILSLAEDIDTEEEARQLGASS